MMVLNLRSAACCTTNRSIRDMVLRLFSLYHKSKSDGGRSSLDAPFLFLLHPSSSLTLTGDRD